MFLKIVINFYNGFIKKNLYGFSVFYKVFPRNRIKMFLKIIINFDNGFCKKIVTGFSYFTRFFQKTV